MLAGQAAAVRTWRLTVSSNDGIALAAAAGRRPNDPSSSVNATQSASRDGRFVCTCLCNRRPRIRGRLRSEHDAIAVFDPKQPQHHEGQDYRSVLRHWPRSWLSSQAQWQGQTQASTTASANRRCRGSQGPAGSRTSESGIFRVTCSGNNIAMMPSAAAMRMAVVVQPYHSMFGPSPLRAAS